MPHFPAFALDRLLEPGSGNPNHNPPPVLVPVKLGRELSYVVSPVLYATPDITPLPDTPSSFSPSPYVVNHKRRGPRLLKTSSQADVFGGDSQPTGPDQKVEILTVAPDEVVENGNGVNNNGSGNGIVLKEENGKSLAVEVESDAEMEDFCDFHNSRSTASSTSFNEIGEPLWKPSTPIGEYYNAFEEISSDGGTRSSHRNMENELHETRFNLLTEIERRRQAEEALENFQNLWQSLHHQLSLVGLKLPETPGQPNINPCEDLYQQVLITRFVAGAIGRACSRAEVEMEIEPQIQLKNFEIARLTDRLQYYEAANREMYQRNQEAVEMARQHRHRKKRRQRWIWNSVVLAVTLGTAAIAWSYSPASNPSREIENPTSHRD
ncbi:uncharacterized protein M6B38_287305 [Iris pallida]|uniref:Uncharacterized protein n=1 Tax=Iris pallida TaxID=29817 RepID=A0AAX6HWT2_IRIPA|nr:uncharacterized protein M6B38_287305 [Iris pallida]